MVISKTPLRISFAGGGTDIKDFFKKEYGCVVNTAINKYVYVCVHKHFGKNSFLVKHREIEEIKNANEIKHGIIREAVKLTGVEGVEIITMSDVTVKHGGVGLGSSSSLLVGLLNALYAFKKEKKGPRRLAEQAVYIEREILKRAGGYQDQYIAAFGGMRFMRFNLNGSVAVKPLTCRESAKKELNKKLLMFYTGITRDSGDIHERQEKKIDKNHKNLLKIKQLALELKNNLEKENFRPLGKIMHENWLLKRSLAHGISNQAIDVYYRKAVETGAIGGKLLGAGGGGFLLFYCEPKNQKNLRSALSGLEEMKFRFEPYGSKIIALPK